MHIDWFVLSCQIFNFLLLVYLLKRFLFGRIIKAMDDREAKIAARFAEADALKTKALETAELYEKRNQQLSETRDKMLNEAAIAAEAKRKEWMEDVRRDVEQLKVRWQDMLVREQDAFLRNCVSVLPNSFMRPPAGLWVIWRTRIWKSASLMNLSGGLKYWRKKKACRYAMPSKSEGIK